MRGNSDIERKAAQKQAERDRMEGPDDPEPDCRDRRAWLGWASRNGMQRLNVGTHDVDDITRRLCARLGVTIVRRGA
jgi:hypothetical protein